MEAVRLGPILDVVRSENEFSPQLDDCLKMTRSGMFESQRGTAATLGSGNASTAQFDVVPRVLPAEYQIKGPRQTPEQIPRAPNL